MIWLQKSRIPFFSLFRAGQRSIPQRLLPSAPLGGPTCRTLQPGMGCWLPPWGLYPLDWPLRQVLSFLWWYPRGKILKPRIPSSQWTLWKKAGIPSQHHRVHSTGEILEAYLVYTENTSGPWHLANWSDGQQAVCSFLLGYLGWQPVNQDRKKKAFSLADLAWPKGHEKGVLHYTDKHEAEASTHACCVLSFPTCPSHTGCYLLMISVTSIDLLGSEPKCSVTQITHTSGACGTTRFLCSE